MTDVPPKPSTSRGLRIALAVSVALNLAVMGMVAGAILRANGPMHAQMPRDLSVGFFTEALTPANRRDLLQRARTLTPGSFQDRRAMQEDLAATVAALRADPFDAAMLDKTMTAMIARVETRLDVGRDLLLGFLTDMSVADRLAFADRLEASLAKRGSRRGPLAGN